MLATLLLILPFAAASAVSPVMLTEQTYLLAKGRKAAKRYALGAFLTVFVFIALATLFGRVISLPTEPTLSASLDVGLGALLVVLGGVLYLIERRTGGGASRRKQEKQRSVSDRRAFAFGIFSMATNLTTLALVLPAAKIIADAGLDYPERLVLETLLALIAAVPAWLPLALTRVSPGRARHALDWIDQTIERHGKKLVAVSLLVLGCFLLLKGIIGL